MNTLRTALTLTTLVALTIASQSPAEEPKWKPFRFAENEIQIPAHFKPQFEFVKETGYVFLGAEEIPGTAIPYRLTCHHIDPGSDLAKMEPEEKLRKVANILMDQLERRADKLEIARNHKANLTVDGKVIHSRDLQVGVIKADHGKEVYFWERNRLYHDPSTGNVWELKVGGMQGAALGTPRLKIFEDGMDTETANRFFKSFRLLPRKDDE